MQVGARRRERSDVGGRRDPDGRTRRAGFRPAQQEPACQSRDRREPGRTGAGEEESPPIERRRKPPSGLASRDRRGEPRRVAEPRERPEPRNGGQDRRDGASDAALGSTDRRGGAQCPEGDQGDDADPRPLQRDDADEDRHDRHDQADPANEDCLVVRPERPDRVALQPFGRGIDRSAPDRDHGARRSADEAGRQVSDAYGDRRRQEPDRPADDP